MNANEKRAWRTVPPLRRRVGTTVLLIDHDMEMVMGLSDHVAVLNFGRLIVAGDPATVRRHPGVIDAYLGAA